MSCSTLSSVPGAKVGHEGADDAGGGAAEVMPKVVFGVVVVELELMAW